MERKERVDKMNDTRVGNFIKFAFAVTLVVTAVFGTVAAKGATPTPAPMHPCIITAPTCF